MTISSGIIPAFILIAGIILLGCCDSGVPDNAVNSSTVEVITPPEFAGSDRIFILEIHGYEFLFWDNGGGGCDLEKIGPVPMTTREILDELQEEVDSREF